MSDSNAEVADASSVVAVTNSSSGVAMRDPGHTHLAVTPAKDQGSKGADKGGAGEWSLLQRTLKQVAIVSVLSVLILLVTLGLRIGEGSRHLFDFRLHQHATEIIRHVLVDKEGRVTVDHSERLLEKYAYEEGGEGKFRYAILNRSGQVVVGSEPHTDPLVEFEPFPVGGSHYFQTLSESTDAILVGIVLGFEVGGRAYWVQAAQNTSHMDAFIDLMIEEFFEDFGWAVIVAFMLVMGAIHLTIRRGLKPLTAISGKARALGPDRLDVRLDEEDLPREILPLVQAVNGALDRLEEGFQRQKEFTADVAHELRTPLTVLMSRLDLTLPREQSGPLFDDLDDLIRLINQLLKEAELDTFILPVDARADLLQLSRDVVARLAPLAIREGKFLEVIGVESPVVVHGAAAPLSQAVRNLVENALRYTPSGETVSVEVVAEPVPEIRVIDRGPGIAEKAVSSIFERFSKPIGGRRHGAGLGLAIVHKIMTRHQAQVSVAKAPEKGSVFTLRFAKNQATE
ncbi:MAG: HAMP domain-containing protein [Magnetococcales bacterium]|nr:HAMP domain-containing protein [Magnetococcales bacterium]